MGQIVVSGEQDIFQPICAGKKGLRTSDTTLQAIVPSGILVCHRIVGRDFFVVQVQEYER